MTKYLLIALVVIAVAAGVFAKIAHDRAVMADQRASTAQEHAKAVEKALAAASRQLAAQRAVSLQRQKELNALREAAEVKQKALNDALQAHPDWARTPVPDGVWDALGAHADAAEAARPSVDGADTQAGSQGAR